MNVGFKIVKLEHSGLTRVKPIKLLSTGHVLADEDFLVNIGPEGEVVSVIPCTLNGLETETVLTKPSRIPVNYRVPCKKHVAKVAQFVSAAPLDVPGDSRLYLMNRPLTEGGIYVPREHQEIIFRHYINQGELYRLARDLHRVDVRLSTTAGYNFELVKDAIANGARPVNFDNGSGTSMSAFFVMGSEWVHTVSSIPELNFGIGIVETSFIDFFKNVVMPYIESE